MDRDSRLPPDLKVLWLLGVWALIGSVILLSARPTAGYEPSLYTAVSPLTWVLIGAGILVGIWTGVRAALHPELSRTGLWKVGWGIVLAATGVVILAPLLRHYVAYGRSDLMIHAGRVMDIVQAQRIPDYDRPSSSLLYPAPFMPLVEIALLTGIQPWALVQGAGVAIFFTGVLFTYLLARATLEQPLAIVLCTLSSCVLLFSSFNYQVMPTVIGITFFPLVLWLYLQAMVRHSVAYRSAFILLGMIYALIHPLTCIYLLLGFAVTEGYRALADRRLLFKRVRLNYVSGVFWGTLWIIFIVLVTWLIHNGYFWDLTIRQLVKLITTFGEGAYSQNIAQLGSIEMSLLDTVGLFIKLYLHQLLFMGLALVGMIVIVRRALYREDPVAQKLMLVVLFMIAQGIISVGVLFGGSQTISYWRALTPITFLAPVVLGYLGQQVYRTFVAEASRRTALRRTGFQLLVTVGLGAACGTGIISYYAAPVTYRLNEQISAAEVQGMDWFIGHRNPRILLDSVTLKYVFGAALQGYAAVDRSLEPGYPKWGETVTVPEHFDYSRKRVTGYRGTAYYLLIHDYDRLYYTLIPRRAARLLPEDFERLDSMPAVDKVYTNGELDLWWVSLPRNLIEKK